MNISELSIRRPVLSTVLTLIILIFGMIGYSYLGVREYPSVDNPIISVNCSYPGANADVIENQITEPLEQNINGIPGIRSLTSVSQQGSSRITVEFELSVDLETAANDVRDKVSRAQRFLPRDCDPPIVSKADADAMPILMIALQSKKRSLLELSEIADLTVKEQLQTIPDVSSVSIWGEKRYSMRLWLDPIKMSGYGITPIDVRSAIDRENVELPSGSIEGNTTELTIRTLGLMHTTEQFNNLIIKQDNNRIIRFSDIGRAELGPADIRSYMKMNGVPMIGIVVTPQPGANHIQIADAVYERMVRMKKDLPEDVVFDYGFDSTTFIRASINEVKDTVFIAFLLVIIIIFLFLRDWRVTIVPCIVIPVSLIGSFFVMYVAGFSINVLSMLAVVLAVGLVVDDAIVMTENIYVRIERGMPPKEAGIEGAKEIFFAVISTTITLIAVFFPILFMDGITGRLFREFSMVISGSVIISSFAALTFTPMLATKILIRREKKSWFYIKTEPFFEGMNNLYSRSLNKFLEIRWISLPFITITILAIIYMWSIIPQEMAPLEDRSQITLTTKGAEGVTYEYIRDYTENINALVDSIIPDAKAIIARVSSGNGNVRVTLKDMNERNYTQMEVAEKISAAVRKKTEARSFVQQSSSFGGRRGSMPVQYVIQATNLQKLQEILPTFMMKVFENPTFQMADVNLKFSKPESRITINRDKAGIMGVSTRNIAQTLQYGLSGQRMGYFYMNGKQYEILGEINRQQRNKPTDLKSIYIRSDKGEMIQLDNLIELTEGIAPPQLHRYNRFVSATVSAGLAKGHTIGEGLDQMDIIAKEVLDDTFRTALAGDSKEYRESSSSLMFAFILAIVLIYLILAAQFESFKDPLIIMLTVPLAIAGALIFMHIGGITMNIFSQIGIIMLIGLVAKNGILIVEFANQKQEMGEDKMIAIKEASLQRLRPILMTSASTILGLLPLALATGEGSNQRIAMGTAVVGGMLVSTLLTMYIVPAIYSFVSTNRKRKKSMIPVPKSIIAILIFICTTPFISYSQENHDTLTEKLSLNKCIDIGLNNNYSLQIVRNLEKISSNNATIGNAGYLPKIDLSSSYRNSLDNNSSDKNIFDQTFNAGLYLNWTIFEGFNIKTNYKKLKELEKQGEINTRIAIEDFIANISAEYYNYIQQNIRLTNLKYSMELSKERLRIVEERYRIGNYSGLDYQQAKVDFNADHAKFLKQQEVLALVGINLNKWMAIENVDSPILLNDSVININGDYNYNLLLEGMLNTNASLLKAERNSYIAQLDYKKVISRSYPYLSLNGGYGYTYNIYDKSSTRNKYNYGVNAGVTLGITIFDGKRNIEKKNANISISNSILQRQELELTLRANLSNLWQSYQSNLKLVKLEQQNLLTAKENYTIANERYMLGDLSGIEMREAQKSLLDAEERLLVTEYNTKICEISLMLISGKILK